MLRFQFQFYKHKYHIQPIKHICSDRIQFRKKYFHSMLRVFFFHALHPSQQFYIHVETIFCVEPVLSSG